jgi:hypothetical protein
MVSAGIDWDSSTEAVFVPAKPWQLMQVMGGLGLPKYS